MDTKGLTGAERALRLLREMGCGADLRVARIEWSPSEHIAKPYGSAGRSPCISLAPRRARWRWRVLRRRRASSRRVMIHTTVGSLHATMALRRGASPARAHGGAGWRVVASGAPGPDPDRQWSSGDMGDRTARERCVKSQAFVGTSIATQPRLRGGSPRRSAATGKVTDPRQVRAALQRAGGRLERAYRAGRHDTRAINPGGDGERQKGTSVPSPSYAPVTPRRRRRPVVDLNAASLKEETHEARTAPSPGRRHGADARGDIISKRSATGSGPAAASAVRPAITLRAGQEVMAGAEAEANKNKWNVVISILDSGATPSWSIGWTALSSELEVAREKGYSAVASADPRRCSRPRRAGRRNLRLLRLSGASGSRVGFPSR